MTRHSEELQRSTDRTREREAAEAQLLDLVRCVAQSTLEYAFDDYNAPSTLWEKRHQIAKEVQQLFLDEERDDPESELALVRRRLAP